MNFVIWIFVGLAAGRLAQVLLKDDWHKTTAGNLVVGVLGAVASGWILSMTGLAGAHGFSIWVPLVAFVGAAGLLWAGRAFTATPVLR